MSRKRKTENKNAADTDLAPTADNDTSTTATDGNAALPMAVDPEQTVDDRIGYLIGGYQLNDITPAERDELRTLLQFEDRCGTRLAFDVLGINEPHWLLAFVARREQALQEMGASTVLERLLLDGALGSNHLRERAIVDGRICQSILDDYLGRRSNVISPDLAKAAEYVRDVESKYSKMQAQLARTTCSYIRALNSLRRTQITLQVKGVQNLNVAGQQVNMQASGNADDVQLRRVTGGDRE